MEKELRVASLKRKFLGILLAVSTIFVVLIAFILSVSLENIITNTVVGYTDVLGDISESLDLETFKNALSNLDTNSEEFQKIHKYLNENLKKYRAMKYLSTLTIDFENKKYTILIDGTDFGEEFSEPGYIDEMPKLPKKVNRLEPFNTKIFDSKEWGTLITLYYPIKDEQGSLLAYLVADIQAEEFKHTIRKIVILVVVLIVLMIIFSVNVVEKIMSSFDKFIPTLQRFSEYNFTRRAYEFDEYLERKDELGIFSRTLKQMNDNIIFLVENILKSRDAIQKAVNFSMETSEKLSNIINRNILFIEKVVGRFENIGTEVQQIALNINVIADNYENLIKYSSDMCNEVNSVIKLTEETQRIVENLEKKLKMVGEFSEFSDLTSKLEDIYQRLEVFAQDSSNFKIIEEEFFASLEKIRTFVNEVNETLKNFFAEMEEEAKITYEISLILSDIIKSNEELGLAISQLEENVKNFKV